MKVLFLVLSIVIMHSSVRADYDTLDYPELDYIYVTEFKKSLTAPNFIVYEIELSFVPEPEESDFVVPLTFYKPKGSTPSPVILIPPNVGGPSIVEHVTAAHLANYDMAALVYKPQFKLQDRSRKVEQFDQAFQLSIFSLKMILDWTKQREKWFDHSKMGVVGYSLGGLLGGYLVGNDSRIDGAFIMAAGGDMPSLMTNSELEYLSFIRQRWLKKNPESTLEDYENLLRDIITVDPLQQSFPVDPKKVFMVIAKKDKIVPTANQYLLWETLGKPDHVARCCGHGAAIFQGAFRLYSMVNFFNERFAATPE